MKVVCSWCRQEGKAEFVGEKPPYDDARETHGICMTHRHEVQARWRASHHSAPYRVGEGPLSAALFYWTSLLSVTKKSPGS
jgi:hypothetical protein